MLNHSSHHALMSTVLSWFRIHYVYNICMCGSCNSYPQSWVTMVYVWSLILSQVWSDSSITATRWQLALVTMLRTHV